MSLLCEMEINLTIKTVRGIIQKEENEISRKKIRGISKRNKNKQHQKATTKRGGITYGTKIKNVINKENRKHLE